MSMSNIIEISCKNENVVYRERNMNGGGLGNLLTIPNNFDEHLFIKFSDKNQLSIPISVIKKVLSSQDNKDYYEQYPNLELLKEILDEDIDRIQVHNYSFPKLIDYLDITDCEFNNFEKIEKSTLISDGLWIGNGIRKIELKFDEEFDNFISSARKKKENETKKIEAKLFINKIDNDEVDEYLSFDIKNIKGIICKELYQNTEDKGKQNFVIYLNTDKFMDFFDENDIDHIFYGYIKIAIRQDIQDRDENIEYIFEFPFNIKLKNPITTKSHQKSSQVAIDFGTSSSCIAKDKGKTLISFSDNPTSVLDYENMTAIILYNWQKIYNAWNSQNKTLPHFNRSKERAEYVDIRKDHYDYGDNIKWELENAPDTKTMDAVITNIKSIPKQLKDIGKLDIIPFDNFKNRVFLTDKLENEKDDTLNPIALYGYLIGRALNLQVKDKIYTNYTITMPVKFADYQKKAILTSLEYGLKRALPLGLRDEIKLSSQFFEPVALLGVAKRLKYLKAKGDKVTLFAVFDFGGGTLDFAFGLYRKAVDDERAIEEFGDELEKYDNVIEIFKTGGEMIGGETLIDNLSYKLYKDHQEIMRENNISIEIPEGESEIKNYPSKLFGHRHVDRINLRSLNETFSREFFKTAKFSKTKVELFSIDDTSKGKEIELNALKTESCEDFLYDKISLRVSNFKKILENSFIEKIDRLKEFGIDEFNIDDVVIIQAGNTCKAKWVKEAFEEHFDNQENIVFLENEEKDITPKNAVARGALMLDGIGIHYYNKSEDEATIPLDRFIWNYSELEDEGEDAEPVFKQDDTSKLEFRRVSRISDQSVTIYYSKVVQLEDEYDDRLLHHTITIPDEIFEDDKNNLWVKPYDGAVIEAVLGNRKGDNFDETKKMFIDLEKGEVIIGKKDV